MNTNRKRAARSIVGAAAAVALLHGIGCAKRPAASLVRQPVPLEQQTLDDLPPVQTPAPATRPSGKAPLEALRLYAEGRDALLRGRRSEAVTKLSAAIEADSTSAIAWLDLGHALLGRDNTRALSSFRQASAFDPHLLDARLQAARLLVDRNEKHAAVEQLRLARVSPAYARQPIEAAAVDLMLGRLLEAQGMATAARDCYERVLSTVERRSFGLQRYPDLAELASRPSALRLRMADLASKAGRPGEAVSLYRKLIADEPAAAPVLRLRIAAVLVASGNLAGGAAETLAVVDQFDASRTSLQAYIDLFADHGGDAAALQSLDAAAPPRPEDAADRVVLAARLERRRGSPADAVRRLEVDSSPISSERVRETVFAYRAAGRNDALIVRLLRMMTDQPSAWPQVARGWRMLMQPAQPSPLRDQALSAIAVPADLAPAKAFVVAMIAQESGKPIVAQRELATASKLNAPAVRRWLAGPADDASAPDIDAMSDRDIALFVAEYADEPQVLAAGVAQLLQQGGKQKLIDALQSAVQRPKSSVALLGPLAVLLEADDQRAEAVRLTEAAAKQPRAAAELYYLSSVFTQLGDTAASERVLRQAFAIDPSNAAVCNDLGYALVDAGREIDFAETLLWKAVGLEPDNPAYIDSLGWMLYKRSKFQDAFDYLDRAVRASDPADPVVLDHAADAAYRLGKADDAVARWKAASEAVRRGASSDPQLRLRIDNKLKQASQKLPVSVAPASTVPTTLPSP